MAARLRRGIVAATVLALSFPVVSVAHAADAPELPNLEAASPRTDAGERFRPDPGSTIPTPRSSRESVQAATPPGTVSGISATTVTSTEARVQWDIPSQGSSSITGYRVQLLQDGAIIDEAVLDATAVWITDLEPDTSYGVRVAAQNSAGEGGLSETLTFATSHFWLERIYGADRFETAVRVSESAFPFEGVTAAFVANGLDFPDALAAAAAGGAFGGPVLLTRAGSVDQATVDEVSLLQPQYVVAAGGTAVVSDAVLDTLGQYATEEAMRADGASRYETAGIISTLWDPSDVVYLASGTTFPDALAGAAAAGHVGAPVLLTRSDSLPRETADYLAYHAPSRLVVLGGTGAVTEAVIDDAAAASGRAVVSIERLSGASRYDTAVDISRKTFTSPRVPVVYIASGQSFADALAGAAAAGSIGGPVLLTSPNSITDATLAELRRLDPVRVVVLGGASVVSPDVYQRILDTLRG